MLIITLNLNGREQETKKYRVLETEVETVTNR